MAPQLPQEILDNIIRQVAEVKKYDFKGYRSSAQTLASLHLADSHCSTTATPLLFETVRLYMSEADSFQQLQAIAASSTASPLVQRLQVFGLWVPYVGGVTFATSEKERQWWNAAEDRVDALLVETERYEPVFSNLQNLQTLCFMGRVAPWASEEAPRKLLSHGVNSEDSARFCARKLLGRFKLQSLEEIIINDPAIGTSIEERLIRTAGRQKGAMLRQNLERVSKLQINVNGHGSGMILTTWSSFAWSTGVLDTIIINGVSNAKFFNRQNQEVSIMEGVQAKKIVLIGWNHSFTPIQTLIAGSSQILEALTLGDLRMSAPGSYEDIFQHLAEKCPRLVDVDLHDLYYSDFGRRNHQPWLHCGNSQSCPKLTPEDKSALFKLRSAIGNNRKAAGLPVKFIFCPLCLAGGQLLSESCDCA